MRRIIGFAVLWPWLRYRFATKRMTPRFDEHGRVYMLICDYTGPYYTDKSKP